MLNVLAIATSTTLTTRIRRPRWRRISVESPTPLWRPRRAAVSCTAAAMTADDRHRPQQRHAVGRAHLGVRPDAGRVVVGGAGDEPRAEPFEVAVAAQGAPPRVVARATMRGLGGTRGHDGGVSRTLSGTMKITDILAAGPTYSFEFFPPKTPEAAEALTKTLTELEPLAPSFASVTYGAGGGTREMTHDIVTGLHRDTNITPMAHLTCVCHTRRAGRDHGPVSRRGHREHPGPRWRSAEGPGSPAG